MGRYSLVMHGGYGGEKNLPRMERLTSLLKLGARMLSTGASSVDVVEKMVKGMEDSGLFNAGKGSVPTAAGTFEMDAAIMDGTSGRAGCATLLTSVKNPISVARAILDGGSVVMMGAHGAQAVAQVKNLPNVDAHYFAPTPLAEPEHMGTVGCVAWDMHGHLAAGTSTGGIRNKPPGRIGDSPLIGSGTYANNSTLGISCTGKGESFILANAAHMAASLLEYRELSLEKSLETTLNRVEALGGTGGMIAINSEGGIAFEGSEIELLCAAAINQEGQIIYPFE